MKRKVARGERQQQALEFILEKQRAKAPWSTSQLAAELRISVAQASALVAALVVGGRLKRGERTVLLRDTLVAA